MDKNNFKNKDIKENLSNFSSSIINSGSSSTKVRNFYITLAKESPKNITYDSSSDTYDSFHLRETDYCKDTTDTLSDSSYTTEEIATLDVVEYEVASRSASEDLYSHDSSSGTEDLFLAVAAKTAVKFHQQYDSSTSDFADSEESIDDIIHQKDAELSSADYWNCVKCKNKQNNPMFRYCEKCYQVRKSHFPPRPPQRKSRSGLRKKLSSTLNKYNSSFNNYNQLKSSLSSLSDNDKKDLAFNKIYNTSVTTTPTTTLTIDFNNSKGFGKFGNNDNNNNSGNSTKNVSGSSSSKRLNYKNNNSAKSQLNSAAESSTDDDDDSDGGSIKNITISKYNQKNRKRNGSNEEDKKEYCGLLDSEDDVYNIHKLNKRKKLILRDTKKITNFFSTPKFSNNLKRKNPFEISLVNNAKRIFVNNSSCSSVTNLTNNYSSSNNSSLTTATSTNNANSINLIEKRDTNLIINNSETDLGLELISNSSNSLKLQKDSGISVSSSSTSTGGPSSSQELFSSQIVVDLGCSSSQSQSVDPTTSKNLMTIQMLHSDDDTISENLDEKDYDSIDDELILKDDKYENKNEIDFSQKSIEILKESVESPKTYYNNDLNSVTSDEVDHSEVKITNYINLSKHLSDFPLSSPSNNEFSPTIRKNSIVARSFSTCSNVKNSPKSTNSIQALKNQSKHKNILGQLNNKNDNGLNKIIEKNEQSEGLDNSKNDSCIVCLDEPKNGVFVHSRFLHLCCCYKCAVKIWNKNKKCPVCNCAVKNVMKLFIH